MWFFALPFITAVLLKPLHAEPVDTETLEVGRCTALFSSAMNTSALQNNAGGVKFWSLQYGRGYVTYAALSMQKRGISGEAVNAEMARHAQESAKQLPKIRNPVDALTTCQQTVGKIFFRIENSGFRLDKGSNATLSDVAAEMARAVRRDLGF